MRQLSGGFDLDDLYSWHEGVMAAGVPPIRAPVGIVVRPDGYLWLKRELSEQEPTELTMWTPQVAVHVARSALWMPRSGKVLLVYDRMLWRAILELDEAKEEGE